MKRQNYDEMVKNGKRKTENGKRKIVEIGILCFILFVEWEVLQGCSRAEHSNWVVVEHSNWVVAEHSVQQILNN